MIQSSQLNILVCQLNPIYGQIQENINRVQVSLQQYNKKSKLDAVVLPELAFSGYIFNSIQEIKDKLLYEECTKGIVFDFVTKQAQRLKSYVVCGYIEKDKEIFYNSAYVVNREGELIKNHRKKHLYEKDKPWAKEGDSFSLFTLSSKKGREYKCSIGICMDINPYEFKDNSKFELADFCKEAQVDMIFLINAWNDHEPDRDDVKSIHSIIDYWLWRLRPLIQRKDNPYNKETCLIVSDRVGKEFDATYVGSSCVVKLNPTELVGYLDKRSESYLNVQVTIKKY